MSSSDQPRSLGADSPVSRGARRRLEIVRVAEQVFLGSGYRATTMDAIARAAGASKETLYRQFGRKENLFAEVVSNRARQLREKLDAEFDQPHGMEAVLRDLGRNLLEHMHRPEVMRLLRMVIAESPRDPSLGQIFFQNGPERTRQRLCQYLAAARDRGEFRGDAGLAATVFLSALVGLQHLMRLTLGDPPQPSAAEMDAWVDEVVALFLGRYGG